MSEAQWCTTCEFHVSLEDLEECQDQKCPLHMPIVDTGDELHKVLGEALDHHFPQETEQ
jgi:hypothetical protein